MSATSTPSLPASTPPPTTGAIRILYTSLFGIDPSQLTGPRGSFPPDQSQNFITVSIYPSGTRPNGRATIAYGALPPAPQIFPAGAYQVDVWAKYGSGTPTLSEALSISPGQRLTVVIRGIQAAAQILNFIEPDLPVGQTAVVFHQASDMTLMGFGFLPPNTYIGRFGPSIPQLFLLTEPPLSGPSSPGVAAGGEYTMSPYPASPSAMMGFGFGDTTTQAPQLNLVGGVAIAGAFPQFAAGIPQGQHMSIFVVDTFSPDNCCRWGAIGLSEP